MTKEEIRKVLDLALEYYKLEIFGTGKESQPPTQERIDYIYDRMQQSLPSNLDEASEKYANRGVSSNADPYEETIAYQADKDAFKAEAEWMAGQGETLDSLIWRDEDDKLFIEAFVDENKFKMAENVTIQVRKKQ